MASEIAEMKLTDHYFLNFIPQNWNFKSQLIASDKNHSLWYKIHPTNTGQEVGTLTKLISKQWPLTQANPGLLDITGSRVAEHIYLQMA